MNISRIHDCYGCGVCAAACAKKIIDIQFNKNGFYEPYIQDMDKCTNCGLCVDVCAFSHDEVALPLKKENVYSWASWSNDECVRRKCSSGGIGFEVAKQLIEKGYKLCGCRYNAKEERAEHYIASSPEEAIQSIGSKYIQSYTLDAFNTVNRKEKNLIVGTPCQIDSFRRYIQKYKVEENFILLDFFCHCVPSILVWKKYIQMVEKRTGKITYASWRNKFTGWHDSWAISIEGEKTGEKLDWYDSNKLLMKEKKGFFNSRLSQGDIFYRLFLGDYCCNPACVKNCKYKYNRSSADIRIGDLWGNTYKNEDKGVSALVSFTEKGKEVIDGLNGVTLIEHSFDIVAEGQMKQNVHKAPTYYLVMCFLKSSYSFDSIIWKVLHFINRITSKVKRIIK